VTLMEDVEKYASNILLALPEALVYHNLNHTREVVKAAQKIGAHSNLSQEEMDIVLIAAWFLFKRGKKYQSILGLITCQIHEMPDQSSYDDLVRGIRRRSQEAGYEPRLRQILDKHGILGPESWQPAK